MLVCDTVMWRRRELANRTKPMTFATLLGIKTSRRQPRKPPVSA